MACRERGNSLLLWVIPCSLRAKSVHSLKPYFEEQWTERWMLKIKKGREVQIWQSWILGSWENPGFITACWSLVQIVCVWCYPIFFLPQTAACRLDSARSGEPAACSGFLTLFSGCPLPYCTHYPQLCLELFIFLRGFLWHASLQCWVALNIFLRAMQSEGTIIFISQRNEARRNEHQMYPELWVPNLWCKGLDFQSMYHCPKHSLKHSFQLAVGRTQTSTG